MLGPILLSIHNLRFYQKLMAKIRQTIENGEFDGWADENLKKYRNLEMLKNTQNSTISL
jgi:tRNA-guanine family transglycosylase